MDQLAQRGLLMLINCPKERVARSIQKRDVILRWLRDETWTTVEMIASLLSMSRQAAWKTLTQMKGQGFVRSSEIGLVGGKKLVVWGITPHGLAFSWLEGEAIEERPYFEPSRISISMISHHLDLQQARILSERAGWSDWVRGERLGFRVKNRPDAIVRDLSGESVAIEVERTIKTKKRYQQIMASHLQQVKVNSWERIIYLSPEKNMADRLKRIFRSIDYVVVNKNRVAVSERHHARFKFHSMNDWLKGVNK